MANKGSKFRKYSFEFKEQILKEYFGGQGGQKSLGKKYNIPHQTIRNWIAKAKKNIDVGIDGRGRSSKGRPKSKLISAFNSKQLINIKIETIAKSL